MENMNEQMNLLLNKMKEEFQKQTNIINETVQQTIASSIEEKLLPIKQETENLKLENNMLKSKMKNLELESKRNNLIIHGVEEKERNSNELMEIVLETLNNVENKLNSAEWDKWEISRAERLGKKIEHKIRPIKITLTLGWRKLELLRNKKYLPKNVKITEDFTKEVLEERKTLIPKMIEARESGKYAIIKHDKLVIKEKRAEHNEKRKRVPSSPPSTPTNNSSGIEDQEKIIQPAKQSKINSFETTTNNKNLQTKAQSKN